MDEDQIQKGMKDIANNIITVAFLVVALIMFWPFWEVFGTILFHILRFIGW